MYKKLRGLLLNKQIAPKVIAHNFSWIFRLPPHFRKVAQLCVQIFALVASWCPRDLERNAGQETMLPDCLAILIHMTNPDLTLTEQR